MGGHGGLNILPQKRWNVYNFDNREKVRKDEEAAAREEQLKREQSRRRDFELRLEKLRQSRNSNPNPNSLNSPNPNSLNSPNPNHINLFKEEKEEDNSKKRKRDEKEKEKAKEKVVVTAEDEKYRLGYGLAGKGVKLPWYMAKARVFDDDEEDKRAEVRVDNGSEKMTKSGGKKSIEELREERMRREKKEKERERALISDSKKGREVDMGFSRRRM